jgi:hypothetical protein
MLGMLPTGNAALAIPVSWLQCCLQLLVLRLPLRRCIHFGLVDTIVDRFICFSGSFWRFVILFVAARPSLSIGSLLLTLSTCYLFLRLSSGCRWACDAAYSRSAALAIVCHAAYGFCCRACHVPIDLFCLGVHSWDRLLHPTPAIQCLVGIEIVLFWARLWPSAPLLQFCTCLTNSVQCRVPLSLGLPRSFLWDYFFLGH